MGQQLKRVPLNFKWPLNKIWKGFVNPHANKGKACPDCKNGYSPVAQHYHKEWYGFVKFDPVAYGSKLFDHTPLIRNMIELKVVRAGSAYLHKYEPLSAAVDRELTRMLELWNKSWSHHLIAEDVKALLEEDRLPHFTHVILPHMNVEDMIRTHAYYLWVEAGKPQTDGKEFWEKSNKKHDSHWLPYNNGYVPTPQEVNLWSLARAGHDSLNANVCIRARCKRAGFEFACVTCGGTASLWCKEDKEAYDNWTPVEPPDGDGYQIWETVSDGSPISPVFNTPERLALWMSKNTGENFNTWLSWINDFGWAPSAIMVGEKFGSGVETLVGLS